MTLLDITLIIPHQGESEDLHELCQAIAQLRGLPKEIIIIDSSKESSALNSSFVLFCEQNNIQLIVETYINLFPGHSRNIGISKASNEVLAFLDTKTLPSQNWLFDNFKLMLESQSDVVMGLTIYMANSFKEKIVRSATFGSNPIQTIPGSIMRASVFSRVGLFIENTRAGEDGDWISRSQVHPLKLHGSLSPLLYTGLHNLKIIDLLSKWFRNYLYTSKLPFFKPHKDFYFYIFFLFSLFLAYNWNSVTTSWDQTSEFYIPNITKIIFASLSILYVLGRGFFLPLRKGVEIKFLLPFGIIPISIISLSIDLVKSCAFFSSKFFKLP